MVVVAIIGILASLLLPAVQAAREAARRSQCGNNLKQMALALANYESTNQVFPSGSLYWWNSSWLVAILPYMDQASVAQRLNFSEAYPFWVTQTIGYAKDNIAVLSGFAPPYLFCPSSNVPRIPDWSRMGMVCPRPIATSCYAGIAGAVTDAATCQDPTGGSRCVGANGCASSNGVLGPNQFVPAASITDGLSNTMLIGEQSDWIIASDGTQTDLRSSSMHGAWIGAGQSGWPQNNGWPHDPVTNDPRYLNCTTLRYPFGYKTDAGSGGGMGDGTGNNMPLQSVHAGVVGVARCDGSVGFLSESTAWTIQRSLAIIDDGQAVGAP